MRDSSDDFPTIMQCADLMAMVQACPTVLELRSVVQFPILKPDSYSLSDFVNALLQNDTIKTVRCNRHFTTGFSDEEWCQILLAFGQIQRLEQLVFVDGGDSRLRRLRIDVLADVLLTAGRLQKLEFGKFWLLMGNDDHRRRFAQSLENHPSLQSFSYAGCGVHTQLYQSIVPRSHPHAILSALTTCQNIQCIRITSSPYCAPDYTRAGLERLVRSSSTTLTDLSLVTKPSNWFPVMKVLMEQGPSSKLERLVLTHHCVSGNNHCSSVLTTTGGHSSLRSCGCCSVEDVVRVADCLKHNFCSLRYLSLRIWGNRDSRAYFPRNHDDDRRISLALADALRTNTTLCCLEISDGTGHGDSNRSSEQQLAQNLPPKMVAASSSGEKSFDAIDFNILAAALRDNGYVQIYVDVGLANNDDTVVAAFDSLRIESNLNAVGRGRLVGQHGVTSAKADDWCEALAQLNERCHNDDGPLLQSCLYQLVRLHPLICCRNT